MPSLFPKPGEWVCFRGNQSLDARSQAVGHITNPAVAWKEYVGLDETILVVEPQSGNIVVTAPGEHSPAKLAEIHDPRWGLVPPPRLLAGSFQSLGHDYCSTYAHV